MNNKSVKPLFNKIQMFSETQILKISEMQQEFLRLIHPFLNEDSFIKECIELRPIVRKYGEGTNFIRSLNLWRLDEKGKEQHLNFLNTTNGQPVCSYYSGFTFDYSKKTFKDDGTKYKKGSINNQNSLYTTILPVDFDNITELEHDGYINTFNNLGIEVISIFTGHGYQDLILLDEKCYDKDIYKKFTYLLLSKGFKADESIIDPARVLRLPHSFNCKSFDYKNKYHEECPEPIPVKRIRTTRIRYKLYNVLDRIMSLPTSNAEYEGKYNDLTREQFNNRNDEITNKNDEIDSKNNNKKSEVNLIEFVSIQEQYHMIKYSALPEGIKNMLTETPSSYRNSVMMFIIPFLRNTLCLSLERIIEVMKVWGTRCKPKINGIEIESEVKRLYSYNNRAASGVYTKELASRFGYIDFNEYNKYELDNKIKISNEFIEHYNVINDCGVKIYLMMKLFEKLENIKVWTIEDILRVSKISRVTFYRSVEDLIKFGFIDKKRSSKKFGNDYSYYINIHLNKSIGYTLFNTSTLRMMVYDSQIPLINSEIKAYTYICKMINNNPTETCWASQETLGQYIGKARNSLTRITESLYKKKYIIKDKWKSNDGFEYCQYTLMY